MGRRRIRHGITRTGRNRHIGSRSFVAGAAGQVHLALGSDPMKDRLHERQSLTFSELAEQYLSGKAEAKLKPGTTANYEIAIRKHAVSDLVRI
ncbi:MAG: hypothetical protein AB1586_19295 [Pseudomonadota bacterium]